ncbi:Hsp70 family protein [Actinopolyspora mortivallis]|nr:Hsp70 family protein [Actinopolyspora mortivallis]
MPYVLGVHLGTTTTSAAVMGRNGGRWTTPVPFPLGTTRPEVPSLVRRLPDGGYLVGEAAAQRAEAPEWTCSHFVTSLGEDAPLLLGGEFVPAQRLVATVVEWVADQVTHRHGYPPEHIAVAHNCWWGPHRTHLVHRALAELGITDVTLLPETLAVAVDYVSKQTVADGGTIVVGNTGGSGSGVAVLRKHEQSSSADLSARGPGSGLEPLGPTVESETPAGAELDELVLERVRTEFADSFARLDPADPGHRAAASRLRAECTRAREELSHRELARFSVPLPDEPGEFELSRGGYERMARARLEWLPEMLVQTVQSVSLAPEDLEAVVLAGGPARTPLLRELVRQRLHERVPAPDASGPPVRVDGSPELVAARGAAFRAAEVLSAATDRAAAGAETSVLMRVRDPGEDNPVTENEYGVDSTEAVIENASADPTVPPPRPPVEVEPMSVEPTPTKKSFKILKLTLAALLIAFGLVMTFVQGFGGQSAGPGIVQQAK